jgi:DNA mismatch repair protein MutL
VSVVRIQVLPDHIANRIAAGEIVERPASVVRELIDNAIDAEPTRIEIEIRNGGKSLITVRDDGRGIDPDSLLIAFERHATSKIKSIDDLNQIDTLGFRGEALPSIASVSSITIESYHRDFDTGTRMYIENGKIRSVESRQCSPGTLIYVKNLFKNVPARRKFLKQTRTEYTHIYETVIDHAITFPKIHFVFKDGDKTILDAPGVDKWSARLQAVLGNRYLKNMLPVDHVRQEIHLQGYLSSPDRMQATARSQRLYVNGRRVRDRVVTQAIYRACREFLSSHQHPVYILKLQLPSETIDVNVHPAKSEIRFQNPQQVFEVVTSVVREILGDSLGHSLRVMSQPVEHSGSIGNTQIAEDVSADSISKQVETTTKPQEGFQNRSISDGSTRQTQPENQPYLPSGDIQDHQWHLVGQTFNTFILFEYADRLFVIDQHTAHERILFEQFKKQYVNGSIPGQSLLFPVPVELDPQQSLRVCEFIDMLKSMGVGVEPFGGNSFLVRSLPEHLKQEPPELLIRNIADELADIGQTDRNRAAERRMLISLACRRAIKAGDVLEKVSMESLISRLFSLQLPSTCPHGRPIIIELSHQELAARFKR